MSFTPVSKLKPSKGRSNVGFSKTVPDCALTPRQLLERYTRGTLTGVHEYDLDAYDIEEDREDFSLGILDEDNLSCMDNPDCDITDVEQELNERQYRIAAYKKAREKTAVKNDKTGDNSNVVQSPSEVGEKS